MDKKELHDKLESIAEELLDISEKFVGASTDICVDDTDLLVNGDNFFMAGGIAAAACVLCEIIDVLD